MTWPDPPGSGPGGRSPRPRLVRDDEREPRALDGRMRPVQARALLVALLVHLIAAGIATRTVHRQSEPIGMGLSFRIALQGHYVSPSPPPAPRPTPLEATAGEEAQPVPEAAVKRGLIVPLHERGAHGDIATAVLAPKGGGSHGAVTAPAEIDLGEGALPGNFQFGYYLIGIRNAIYRAWAPPKGAAAAGELTATVRFAIHRDGSVTGISVERSSGVGYFDQAAASAVRVAAPFSPLPHGYDEDQLIVHFGFRYAE